MAAINVGAQPREQVMIQVGNQTVYGTKSQPRDNKLEAVGLPISYEQFRKLGKSGLRGSNGKADVLLYTDKTNGKIHASAKIVDANGTELCGIWFSKNMVSALLKEHQEEFGGWKDTVAKVHETGNATVQVDTKALRFYTIKNTEDDTFFTVIGTIGSGGNGIA